MSRLFKQLKEVRSNLGITQVELAYQAGISLPTVQNMEANRANPSLETLESLANFLGLEVCLVPKKSDWETLSLYGVPLIRTEKTPTKIPRTVEKMIQALREACSEIQNSSATPDYDRKLEAVQAFLLALEMHFPSVFKEYCRNSNVIIQTMPRVITGRLIKLRRLALANLVEYL